CQIPLANDRVGLTYIYSLAFSIGLPANLLSLWGLRWLPVGLYPKLTAFRSSPATHLATVDPLPAGRPPLALRRSCTLSAAVVYGKCGSVDIDIPLLSDWPLPICVRAPERAVTRYAYFKITT
ncbi:hypothetical protein M9458_016418, partial [Cirrhinus mrigala]